MGPIIKGCGQGILRGVLRYAQEKIEELRDKKLQELEEEEGD